MKLIVIILISVLSSVVWAGTIDPRTDDNKYLEYAQDFIYIGQILGVNSENLEYMASGVVIKPNFILTAAHVVDSIKTCKIKVGDKEFPITKIMYQKEYSQNKVGYYDIAIGYSEERIELNFYPELYSKKDEVGKLCCMAGFGFTGTFNTGAVKSDNRRRAGSNIVDYIDRHLLICSPSISNNRTSLEFLIASGDSGGGLFIDGKLAGINSCVMAANGSPKSDYKTESGHTRISESLEWILENTKDK
jgi:hypothetical protein